MNSATDLDESDLGKRLLASAEAICNADGLLIGAGAGLGVDSGLPDFRGPDGFWKAYPPFRGKAFADISTPHWFHTDPTLAWGFFGHRLNLYRAAVPHRGFGILQQWSNRLPLGAFVFTTNVDGQFQKAGIPQEVILERHGSIHYLQCTDRCGELPWSATDVQMQVDELTVRARSEFPRCPRCEAIARPNILMFGDWDWEPSRYLEQSKRYMKWRHLVQGKRLVAIELGAGLEIPTVRAECEDRDFQLIRINPRESETVDSGIALPMGALDALERIETFMT